jgi:hypothetical protein
MQEVKRCVPEPLLRLFLEKTPIFKKFGDLSHFWKNDHFYQILKKG